MCLSTNPTQPDVCRCHSRAEKIFGISIVSLGCDRQRHCLIYIFHGYIQCWEEVESMETKRLKARKTMQLSAQI